MSLAAIRLAAAEGSMAGTPTTVRVRATTEQLTYGIPVVALPADTPVAECNVIIDWGDGEVSAYPIDSSLRYSNYFKDGDGTEIVHTYALPGEYLVRIDSRATDIMFGKFTKHISEDYGDGMYDYANDPDGYADMVEAVLQWGPAVSLGSVARRVAVNNALGSIKVSTAFESRDSRIQVSTFCGCKNLTYIAPTKIDVVFRHAFFDAKIPSLAGCVTRLTTITSRAFFGNYFTDLTWWPGLTSIDNGVFAKSRVLTSLNGLQRVSSIAEYSFQGCKALTSLAGLNVDYFPSYCFSRCTGLSTIEVPAAAKVICYHAFSHCNASRVTFDTAGGHCKPNRIDQTAFIGQAATGEFTASTMTPEEARAITGHTTYYGYDGATLNGKDHKEWFTCDPFTFAPWGLGKNWTLVFNDNGVVHSVPHSRVLNLEFIADASLDENAPDVPGTTRLDRLEELLKINPNYRPVFSPYTAGDGTLYGGVGSG